ncbi:MAG: hypothetical protein HZB29_03845 [Nitrospinae bacterium]|nr:hypothetical protein [Nitrospinota bacterium]
MDTQSLVKCDGCGRMFSDEGEPGQIEVEAEFKDMRSVPLGVTLHARRRGLEFQLKPYEFCQECTSYLLDIMKRKLEQMQAV